MQSAVDKHRLEVTSLHLTPPHPFASSLLLTQMPLSATDLSYSYFLGIVAAIAAFLGSVVLKIIF